MHDLLELVTRIAAKNNPDKVESLAELIRKCPNSHDASLVTNWATSAHIKKDVEILLVKWGSTDISAEALAGILIGACFAYHTAKKEEELELVWTGPSTPMMSTRRTEQALLEVINSSKASLFIVSFVAYEVGSVTKALNDAIDRGVNVSILMEPAEVHGGHAKDDCFASMKYAVPRARLYVWSDKNKNDEGGGYRLVHAKCSVADGRIAFITSANLTNAAMDRNMELGVLIKGDDLPKKLQNHLDSLITTNIIVHVS